MFKRWFSLFWRNNKEKIKQIAKLIGFIILISVIASMIFSRLNTTGNNAENVTTIYNPSKTIISGSNVSKKEYENKIVQMQRPECAKKVNNRAIEN